MEAGSRGRKLRDHISNNKHEAESRLEVGQSLRLSKLVPSDVLPLPWLSITSPNSTTTKRPSVQIPGPVGSTPDSSLHILLPGTQSHGAIKMQNTLVQLRKCP